MLRDFALSDQGADSVRMEALLALQAAGAIPEGEQVMMVVRGQRQAISPLTIEVTDEPEPDPDVPDDIQDLIVEAHDAIYSHQYKLAEKLARKGLELLPDYRVFLNYLANALQGQNRRREAEEVFRHTAEVYPDYFFARAAMAEIAVRAGDLDEADEWLQPFITQTKFHTSEFGALAALRIQIAMERGEKQVAERWLSMLEALTPDYPGLPALRRRVEGRKKVLF